MSGTSGSPGRLGPCLPLLALPPSELGEVLEELGPLSGKLVLEGWS